MKERGRYTESTVRMARVYFLGAGVLALCAGGALLLFGPGESIWVAILLSVVGAVSLVYAFVRSGNRVVDAARDSADMWNL